MVKPHTWPIRQTVYRFFTHLPLPMATSPENPFSENPPSSDSPQSQGPLEALLPFPALKSATQHKRDTEHEGDTKHDISTKEVDVPSPEDSGRVEDTGSVESTGSFHISGSSGDRESPPQESPPQGPCESLRQGYLSRRVLELLPKLLAKPASRIGRKGDRRKRDVFLTGALPMWAGALPNVRFRYGGSGVSPNLYSATIAPPASGKSALRHARTYGSPNGSSPSRSSATQDSPAQSSPGKGSPGAEQPTGQPAGRPLFLAADSSAAALTRRLEESPHGVIFETEFQSLSRALGSSWGSFTDVLLKGFQNETIKMSRSSKGTVTIPHPAPSIALAGTPAAFDGIMSGTGDGLFSRFLFYRFDREFAWSSQFGSPQSENPQSGETSAGETSAGETSAGETSGTLEESLQGAGEAFREARRRLHAREAPLWVRIPGPLQDAHTWVFRSLTEKWRTDGTVPQPMQASLARAGLQAVKIAVVLRGVRLAETGVSPTQSIKKTQPTEPRPFIELAARDMEAGLRLSLTYLLHAIGVGTRVQKQDGSQKQDRFQKQEAPGPRADLTGRQRKYLEALPEESFSTAEAKDLASSFGASERGVQRWLKDWREAGLLRKLKRGTWTKQRPKREDSPETEGPAGAESVISVINDIPALAGT